MICIVQRQFPGPDGMIAVGTRVDVSKWRPMNVESLLRNRFLQPVSLTEEATDEAPASKGKAAKPTVKKVKKQKRVLPDEDDE